MLIGAAVFSLFFQLGPPVPPPAPPAVIENRVVNEVHVIPQPLDPEAVAEASVQATRAQLGTVVAPLPVQWATELLNLPDFWRQTPPEWTYRHQAIRDRSDLMWGVVGALFLLVVVGFGILTMTGQHPSAGRAAFALICASTSLQWWAAGIDLNNGINQVINAPDLSSLIRPKLAMPTDPVEQTAAVVITVVYAIAAILLIWRLLYRLVLIQILIAIGPLALLCWALPQTEHLASKYVHLSVGTLFSQVLIVLGLSLAQIFSSIGGLGGTLLGIVILLSIRQLPDLLAGGLSGGGRSMAGTLRGIIRLPRIAFR